MKATFYFGSAPVEFVNLDVLPRIGEFVFRGDENGEYKNRGWLVVSVSHYLPAGRIDVRLRKQLER